MNVLSNRNLGERTTITYPHCNGFLPDGSHLVLCCTAKVGEEPPFLLLYNLQKHTSVRLPEFPFSEDVEHPEHATISIDIAKDIPRIFAIYRGVAAVLDVVDSKPGNWRTLCVAEKGVRLQGLPSITPDGKKCLIAEDHPNAIRTLVEYDIESDQAYTLFSKTWHANHFQYSPHDPMWVGFAHEGPAESIMDRCWAWHPEQAPDGICVFDQKAMSHLPDLPLSAGHERWCFHDNSLLVVVYAISQGSPRGIYEAYVDGRRPRLLWECNTAWHCNIDATGRLIVLDTSAEWDYPPASPGEHAEGVARHLHADRTKTENLSDIVLIDLKRKVPLHVDRVVRRRHPYHPHPALSPDGRWLVYTDYDPEKRGVWLVEIALEAE